MNSPVSARSHYESKHHEKKVNQWLSDWAQRTGQPMPKRQKKAPTSLTVEGPKGPNAFFCEHCQIPFTSAQHANQHFIGKRHRMVVAGKICPKGSGYYDKEGNWVKTKRADDDPTSRFGIGTSFLQTPVEPVSSNTSKTLTESSTDVIGPGLVPTQIQEKPVTPKNVNTSDPNRYCSLCNISVTSDLQMQTHLNGAKHRKNSAKSGIIRNSPPPTPVNNSWPSPPHGKNKVETIADCYNEDPKTRRNEFSIFRTPSGQYYCHHCNVTSPNEPQFALHVQSKAHAKSIKVKK